MNLQASTFTQSQQYEVCLPVGINPEYSQPFSFPLQGGGVVALVGFLYFPCHNVF